ncbi:MAG TPA: hypothetical protein VGE34_04890 [Candidatus Saccharimonadales bacterium]
MEPKSSEQMPTPIEYTPVAPGAGETRSLAQPEVGTQGISVEKAQEQLRQVTSTSQPADNSIATLPTPIAPTTQADDSSLQDDDTPQAAGDDDVIEKEWVDKAKKVISETKDDPYKQERAVSKLQADYLRKRYGKQLGEST